MTAIEFWSTAHDILKIDLCNRAGVAPYGSADSEQCTIDLPFWYLPNELKAVVYESPEFRNA